MAEQIVDVTEANMPASSDVVAAARGAGGAAGEEAGRRAASAVVGDVSDRVDVVSARVDGLVASGDGDGGDVGEELRDVRVEWTGGTADTAGGAVRAQFEDLDSRALKIPTVNGGFVNYDVDPQPPYDDLDTFPRQTLVVVNNDKVQHRPCDGLLYVLTLGSEYYDESLLKYQLAVTNGGSVWGRSIYGSVGSAWSGWMKTAVTEDRAFGIPAGLPISGISDSNMAPPWDDCDTFASNSVAVCATDSIGHLPTGFKSGFVVTLGMPRSVSNAGDGILKMQIAVHDAYPRRGMNVRTLWGNPGAKWTEWAGVSQNEATLSNPFPNGGFVTMGSALGELGNADNFPANSIVMVAYSDLPNLPVKDNGWMITYGVSLEPYREGDFMHGLLREQVFHAYDGSVWTRHIHGSQGAPWTGWRKVGGPQDGVSVGGYTDFGIFKRIACLGDSYTQGALANSGGKYLDVGEYGRPWPSVVADRCQVLADNYGVGGSTTKSYWTNSMSEVLSGEPADGYFYCWGINDASTADNFVKLWDGLAPLDHLGTPDDIVADADATPANTFYGYYSSIIRKCMRHAPAALHTIIAMPIAFPDTAENKAYIEATLTLADRMGLPCMDPRDDPFFRSATYKAMHQGHPTRQGYIGMAKAYMRLFGECVERNASYYTNAVIG